MQETHKSAYKLYKTKQKFCLIKERITIRARFESFHHKDFITWCAEISDYNNKSFKNYHKQSLIK